MNTLQEIKTAIASLNAHDKTLLAAQLFAKQTSTPDESQLERSLQRGLEDVRAGRVQPLETVSAMIPEWTTKS